MQCLRAALDAHGRPEAHADPIEYRLELLDAQPRGQNVVRTARDRSGWSQRLPAGRGRGIAFMNYGGTYVAHVAEVTVRDDTVSVDRVTSASTAAK